MTRKVACLARSNLKKSYQHEYLILKTTLQDVAGDFEAIEFIEKGKGEQNENFKQLIPYTVLINHHGKIGLYKRRGTEERLHGLWSAGFGGHIEDFEFIPGRRTEEIVRSSALRELKEEFSARTDYQLIFRGIINEEQTRVGRTHIAWVYTAEVDENLFQQSDEIKSIHWVTPGELHNYKTELWSEMAIELILKK